MQKITPHLWFDTQAKEAAEFYVSLFPNSKIKSINTIHDTPSPSGDCDIVAFELAGQPFMAISAGPVFQFNPSISFIVNFDPIKDPAAKDKLDVLWNKLIDGGQILLPLGKYPFSEHYGWVQDKYGLSWQLLMPNPKAEPRPFIIPALMFTGPAAGRAEEAMNFYISVFKNSKVGMLAPYPKDMEADKAGTLMFGDFALSEQWFAAMDSAHDHGFGFNEAISMLIPCQSQEEIDYYWDKLSADPTAEQCGWLKDKFGVSWQVWPVLLAELMSKGTAEQTARVTQAFLKMKKYHLAELQQAFDGK